MNEEVLEQKLDQASRSALDARSRIEAAVDAGLIPIWVLEACEVWEQCALAYGSASAELKRDRTSMPPMIVAPAAPNRLH